MKKAYLVLGMCCMVFLTSCSLFNRGNKDKSQAGSEPKSESTTAKEIVGSIKDAMTAGQAMQCSYKDKNGQVTTLIKGKMMKVVGYEFSGKEGEMQQGMMVSDGTMMYVWQEGEDQGMKYNLAELQEIGQELAQDLKTPNLQDPSAWAESIDGQYDVACEAKTISDSEFQPPATVEFQDMSAMMKGIGEMAKQFMNSDSGKAVQEESLKNLEEQLNNLQNSTGNNIEE